MKNFFTTVVVLLGSVSAAFAIVIPKNNGSLPQVYYELKEENPKAFQLERAWIRKVIEIKNAREAYLRSRGPHAASLLPHAYQVTDTFRIPVVLGNFNNTTPPYAAASLQMELFDGPWPTGTLTEYFNEVSYGNLAVVGTVYDWVNVSQNDLYYEGIGCMPGPCNGLVPGFSRTGHFIQEILDALDSSVDFGQYDNDGPDGIPNSGDDDGYVDLLAVVHPEFGAECDETGLSNNFLSHQWLYRAWPVDGNNPYTTGDFAAGGGFIKIDDYSVMPAVSCDEVNMIEIGVFCHEFGHGLGLPDLYDTEGPYYSAGIGEWGLMGSGNWNSPESPAHMCAWSKSQMGWIVPTDVTWEGVVQSIPQVATNPVAFRFSFTDNRFSRCSECAINGLYSLRCGLTDAEGDSRNWDGSGGYGNNWNESIEREFMYDGGSPVMFSYDYKYEVEVDYDYIYMILEVGDRDTVLASYTGVGMGRESMDLAPVLSALGPPVPDRYTIRFLLKTDFSYSDEDGGYTSLCGAIVLDSIQVVGGGEDYFANFEQCQGGWYQNPAENTISEYWLVENRRAVGFDANLHGPGLLISHCDDEVMASLLGNTGGPSDEAVRGVVIEEADAKWDLAENVNRGDDGDVYPGSSGNTSFSATSDPNSNDNTNRTTQIEVSGITSPGETMSAFVKAGDPPPDAIDAMPDTLDNDLSSVDVEINGLNIAPCATFYYVNRGVAAYAGAPAMSVRDSIIPKSIRWSAYEMLGGNLNIYSKHGGNWTLVVVNPDGQVDSIPNALYLNFKVSTTLRFAALKPAHDSIELTFALDDLAGGESIVVTRSPAPDGYYSEPDWTSKEYRQGLFHYLDTDVEAGMTYYYRIELHESGIAMRYLFIEGATVPAGQLLLHQNYPNPFNPRTTISFYLPKPMHVDLIVFDVAGNAVRTISKGVYSTGLHRESWDGRNDQNRPVGSGIYFCRLQAGKEVITRKMMLLK